MSKNLPDFQALRSLYRGDGFTAEQIKTSIGGDVNSEDIDNTCIVRLSEPLNAARHLIPPWTKPFRTRRGNDKRWYGLRVSEFWTWLTANYGKPVIHKKGPLVRKDFETMQGIIGFKVSRFKGATGHFTLWDGYELLYGSREHDYFAISDEAALWQAGTTRVTRPDV